MSGGQTVTPPLTNVIESMSYLEITGRMDIPK